MRNRGDTVRFLESIFRDRQVRSIGAHEGDVSSMQRRYHRQSTMTLDRLAREDRANRMGDGVMHMQQIEILVFSYGRHLRRQRQRVRLMLEQRIRHHLDFMKTHALIQFSQPRRQSRGDEMHGVPALGKFFPQLRAHNAAATIGRIDCDADIHERMRVCSGREREATSETNSNSVEPISRFAMLVGNGYYDDCLFIDAVNQRIRKPRKEEPSNLRLNLLARIWIQPNEPNNTIQLIEEFTAEAFFS